MYIDLAHWLTEQRSILLPRWETSLIAPAQGQPNGQGSSYLQPLIVDQPAAEYTDHQTFAQIYDSLVCAARGETSAFDPRLQQLKQIDGWQQAHLPDILALIFQFRRVAGDMLQQEAFDPPTVMGLLNALSTLLEQIVDTLVRSWEDCTEARLQDRISQAEFIAESLASATEEADRRALQLSALNRVSQDLSSSLESENLIDLVGESLLNVLGVAHVAIWLPRDYDDIPEACQLYLAHTWGTPTRIAIGTDLEQIPGDTVMRAHTSASILFERRPDPTTQGAWYQADCAIIALPLLVKEHSTGVVILQDPKPEEHLTRAQQDLAWGIITQAAIALENARLYTRIRQFNNELEQLIARRTSELMAEKERLRTLYDITKEVSSTLDLDTLLDISLEKLALITQAEHGSIMLVEPDTDHLVTRASLDPLEQTLTRFPIGSGIAGWVAHHKEPSLIADVSTDPRRDTMLMGDMWGVQEGSMVVVPLIAQHEILGVLILTHQQCGFFNEDHERLLMASTGGIAVGIHNANLYNTIVQETERRGELLRRQQETTSKLAAILQSLSDGVLVCDTEGRVLSTNAAAGRILQRDIEELVLWNLHDLLARYLGNRGEDMPLKELLACPLDRTNEPRIFETTARIGVHVIKMTMGPVLREEDGEMIGALLVMRDMTREIEADRMKTEFIGTMSHELRTPMTAIKGFTQLLGMGSLGQVNDTQRELLTTIQTNAERMIAVINDVLDITKIETGNIDLELRPIHMAEALSGVIAELQPIIQRREHALAVSIPPGLLLVQSDAHRLHQILYNLLSNAAKYTPCGGQIQIEAHEAMIDTLPRNINDSLHFNRRYVQIDIRDTGVGIAAEDIGHIFERFYRTDNPLKIEAGGTGLGLSLAKPLVELLGGQIWVESTVNEGSTFSFLLPAA